ATQEGFRIRGSRFRMARKDSIGDGESGIPKMRTRPRDPPEVASQSLQQNGDRPLADSEPVPILVQRFSSIYENEFIGVEQDQAELGHRGFQRRWAGRTLRRRLGAPAG